MSAFFNVYKCFRVLSTDRKISAQPGPKKKKSPHLWPEPGPKINRMSCPDPDPARARLEEKQQGFKLVMSVENPNPELGPKKNDGAGQSSVRGEQSG